MTKTIIASLLTAVVVAGGAQAYDAAVPPQKIAALEARISALEAFKRQCLQQYNVHLTENADGAMVWGIGAPTPHAGRFWAIPDTARIPLVCLQH
jgi:hypothetical protein